MTEGVLEYLEGIAKKESRSFDAVSKEYFEKDEPTSLIQRFISPEEIGHAVLFVVENAAVNGSALRVEGGIIRAL
jgi:NAD(P)-dependent dehydrogenase (short-subunit alcohol dehydrogenase family)